jgi:hypothetical protein
VTEQEERELRAALQAALHLLGEVESDARNVQLVIARFRRRHAAALALMGVGPG